MTMDLLVVDDEEMVGRIFSQRLRKEIRDGSVRLHLATSGAQALEVLDSLGPGPILVLTDINMPGMTGLELVKRIRARGGQVRVYVVSAYENDDYRRTSLAAGADGFIPKPMDFGFLRDLLDLG
jgi:CheY-like chemotaxis protein